MVTMERGEDHSNIYHNENDGYCTMKSTPSIDRKDGSLDKPGIEEDCTSITEEATTYIEPISLKSCQTSS